MTTIWLQEKEPWCFTNDDLTKKEVCGIPVCSTFNLWLYIAVPTVSGLAIIGRTTRLGVRTLLLRNTIS